MRTRLTDMLGIEHPVMLAGMGGVSYHRLVAAVSEAGGFGCFGASTMTAEQLADEMRRARQATAKPFGVDLLTAFPETLLGQVELLIEGGAAAFVAGLGVPGPAIDLCHKHDVLVVNMCGKVEHARRAVDAGCDLVVAQGTEAGGHTGQVATFPLVPQIADAVGDRVPVVAAGGIFDGRGLAAALTLGADGVWVGTVISRAFTGKTLRAVRNSWTDWHEQHPEELLPFPHQLGKSIRAGAMHLGADESTPGVDPDRECYPAGQGTGAIHDLVPAGELVRCFVAEAEEALERARGARV